jgi:hypothetical protein
LSRTDDAAFLTYQLPGHEGVETRPGAQVEHRLAGLQAGMLDGKATTEAEIGFGHVAADSVIGISDHVVVARRLPLGSTARCGAAGRRVAGDLGVFVTD